MKRPRTITVLVLTWIVLSVGLNCWYEQKTKDEYYNKGIVYGIQGQFKAAKVEFERALQIDSLFIPLTESTESIRLAEDVLAQKTRKTNSHLFIQSNTVMANKEELDEKIPEIN